MKKNVVEISKKIGKNCIPIYLDVSNEDNVKKVSRYILKKNKRIDILINNAAINPTFKKIKTKIFLELKIFKFLHGIMKLL